MTKVDLAKIPVVEADVAEVGLTEVRAVHEGADPIAKGAGPKTLAHTNDVSQPLVIKFLTTRTAAGMKGQRIL